MSGLVSVVTPVHAPAARFLRDAYESLRAQQLPDGWMWEWLIQGDGWIVPASSGFLPVDDPRISLGHGRHGGPGVARNLALARARGSLVKVLDADDQFAPGALARDIAVLAAQPDVAWTTSRVLDLLPDGSTVGFEHDPPEGHLAGSQVVEHWRAHNYRAAVHPATLCVRREHLLDGAAGVRGHRPAHRARHDQHGTLSPRGGAAGPEMVRPEHERGGAPQPRRVAGQDAADQRPRRRAGRDLATGPQGGITRTSASPPSSDQRSLL